jgi:hypothetical protein
METEQRFYVARNKGGDEQSVIVVGIIVIIMKVESSEQKEDAESKRKIRKGRRETGCEIKSLSCGFFHCVVELPQVDANETNSLRNWTQHVRPKRQNTCYRVLKSRTPPSD